VPQKKQPLFNIVRLSYSVNKNQLIKKLIKNFIRISKKTPIIELAVNFFAN